MKKYIITSISLILCLLVTSIASAATDVKEVKGSKGLKAWLIEDPSLPIVAIKIAFVRSGSVYDPVGKEGMANMVVNMIDEGAGDLTRIDFKNTLEEKAISFYVTSDEDNIYLHLKTLTEHLDEALKLVNLAITKPRFSQEDIDRVRNQIILSIEKNKESPEFIANKRWNEVAYGEHHYGRDNMGTAESLNAISKDDLHQFVRSNFANDNIIISAVGDITKAQLTHHLDHSFKGFAKSQAKSPLKIGELEVVIPSTSQPEVVPFDIPQSVAIFGIKGVKRNDPNFYPAYIMNHILGNGGFESRLMNEVREKRGLAYAVYTYMATYEFGGVIKGYVATENHRIKKSIGIIKKEIEKLKQRSITQKELDNAKKYLIGSFPLRLDKNASLANFLMFMQIEELGIDFLKRRNQLIEQVTLEQVHEVSEQLLDVDRVITVVVGSWPGKE
ncbi:MAG: insulinase family protein [Rickettsiales bacterium]|nr:insulinase family protein [Rickettsiales bacterium]